MSGKPVAKIHPQLKKYTTIKIAGAVEELVFADEFIEQSPNRKWPSPIRILGNGSNVLIDDSGLKGTIVLARQREFPPPERIAENSEFAEYRVSASHFAPALSKWAAQQGLSGLEYLVGVPGTLGGALVQNAGANEQEMSDVLISAELFDWVSQKGFRWSAEECGLTYRHSNLMNKNLLVRSLGLRLRKADADEIQKRTELNLSYRKEKTPWTKASLGSTFARLKKDGGGWHYPGALIEQVGLKGQRVGEVSFSEVHANYLVNHGQADFRSAVSLIREARRRVRIEFGLELPLEIHLWTDSNLDL